MKRLNNSLRIGFILLVLYFISAHAFAQVKPKPLCNCWYTYKQLVKRGYHPDKFKGRVFITYQRYLNLVNNKPL